MDETAKRDLLRKIPHALYACGVRSQDGQALNVFTASWVTQSSFRPPQVVMAVKVDSGSNQLIRESGVFALSFFDSSQQDLAQRFFQPARRVGDKLNDVSFALGANGCPVLSDALGHVECEVVGQLDLGDHTVFVGQVTDARAYREGAILELSETPWQYGG